jgi:hypothetical protein
VRLATGGKKRTFIANTRLLRLGGEPSLQINSPVDNTSKVQALSPLRTLLLRRGTHVGNPISHALALCSEGHDIRIRSLIIPCLGRDALLTVLGIVRNLADLGVGKVAGFTGAHAGLGLGDAEAAGELARGTGAFGVLHLEAAAVAGDADDDLGGVDASLGDHGEGVEGLGLVDVGAETVAIGAARADHGVAVVCRSQYKISKRWKWKNVPH